MNLKTLENVLADLPIGGIRYFERVGSTNDVAAEWLVGGAPDLALVIADEQTTGRGRSGREWFTPPQAALAFSLVLRFDRVLDINQRLSRLAGLGGLAVCDALSSDFHLPAEIKWPNDVLVRRRKVAGVLVEAQWQGDRLEGAVLGIGLNVSARSVPPPDKLAFPATCIDAEAGKNIERPALLRAVLGHLLERRRTLDSDQFLQSWEQQLAFRGEVVHVSYADHIVEGRLSGLNEDGSLRLAKQDGTPAAIYAGDVRLRPVAE